MKKTIFLGLALFFVAFLTIGANVIGKYFGIHKGTFIDGKRVLVSATTATNLISSTTYTYTDWTIKNSGPYELWIDSSAAVSITGVTESYKLAVNESISAGGRTYGVAVWGLSVTGDTTAHILIMEDK